MSLAYVFNFFFYYFRLFLLGVATANRLSHVTPVDVCDEADSLSLLASPPDLGIDLMTFSEVRPLPLFKHWSLPKLNVGRRLLVWTLTAYLQYH